MYIYKVCFAEYDRMFYDLDDPEMMYELDRRHRHWLKENGVIRQGVLWRKEELLEWFQRCVDTYVRRPLLKKNKK